MNTTTQESISTSTTTKPQLFVHVGIPKSGTTTIQDAIRVDPKVNYIQTHCFHKRKYWDPREFELDTTRPNLVSDETYVVRGELGRKVPMYCILERVLNEDADVKLLLTIRNQNSSLLSMFKFRILLGNSFKDFTDWLTLDEGMDFYSANQFGSIVRMMTSYVPLENIKVMLFEDLCADQAGFYTELYQFLGIEFDPDALDLTTHSNRTPPQELVYARNKVNRFLGNRKITKRIKKLLIMMLSKVASKEKISEFYATQNVPGYDSMMEEIKRSNHLLLDYFPELESKLRQHNYPL